MKNKVLVRKQCSMRKYLTTEDVLAAVFDPGNSNNEEEDSCDVYRYVTGEFRDSDRELGDWCWKYSSFYP